MTDESYSDDINSENHLRRKKGYISFHLGGMYMPEGIMELDIHGMTQVQAKTAIDAKLRRAGSGVYRLRIIHGYHSGTALRDMIRREYAGHPKVERVELGLNQGVTDLILREY